MLLFNLVIISFLLNVDSFIFKINRNNIHNLNNNILNSENLSFKCDKNEVECIKIINEKNETNISISSDFQQLIDKLDISWLNYLVEEFKKKYFEKWSN